MSKPNAGINTSGSGSAGAPGADGADGKTILYGTSAPTTEGVDGDFYIRTTTNMLYGPKSSGTWPSGTSLVGPDGSDGAGFADIIVDAGGGGTHTTIADGLAAVPVGGGTVFIKSGTYSISAALTPITGTVIIGEGISTVITPANSANINVFSLSSVTDVSISNLKISGNSANETSGSAFLLSSSDRIRIDRVTITDCAEYGVKLASCTYVSVTNSVFTSMKKINIYVSALTTHLLVQGNSITTSTTASAHGISFDYINNFDVLDNHITIGLAAHKAIVLGGGNSLGSISRNTITGITSSSSNKLEVNNSTDIHIQDNVINIPSASSGYGMAITLLSNSVVSGNTVTMGNGTAAVSLVQNVSVSFVSNDIYYTGSTAALALSSDSGSIIDGNQIVVTAAGAKGIVFSSSNSKVIITNNSIRLGSSSTGVGIDADSVNYLAISNNYFSGNTSAISIKLTTVTYATVTGNTSSYGGGIYTSSTCTDIDIVGNSIMGLGTTNVNAVSISSTTRYTVANNNILVPYVATNGYAISVATTCNNGTITGNAIKMPTSATAAAINVASTCTDVAIDDNNIIGGGGTGAGAGIKVTALVGGSISKNRISGCGAEGVQVITGSKNLVIDGNVCNHNGIYASSTYRDGIVIVDGGSGTTKDLIVANNRCYDDNGSPTQVYGIRLVSAPDNLLFSNNVVVGNVTAGILLASETNTTFQPYRKLVNKTVNSTQTTIAHGLSYAPTSIQVLMTSAGNAYRSASSDATNIYLTADADSRTADILVG